MSETINVSAMSISEIGRSIYIYMTFTYRYTIKLIFYPICIYMYEFGCEAIYMFIIKSLEILCRYMENMQRY